MTDTAPDDSPGYLRALHMLARKPGHAITLEEHRALTANSGRALTDSPIMRHRKGDGHTDIGAFS